GQMSGHLSAICPPEIELEKKIELEIEREIEKDQGQPARPLGRYQNVMLNDQELSELQSELSTSWSYYVEKLSEYMASTGRQYQSHAATIRRWAAEDMRRQSPQRDYSVKAGDTV
ncbi:MAG: replication protein, partial [Clostridia bacterium]|nr:replication protein [Clostridia bacterium]